MNQKTNQQRNYTLPIAIMFALFFMIAFVTGYQNPLGEVIRKMTGENAVLSQLGTLANFIAYAFMGYPAGKLLERSGYRMTALWAVTVGFIGVAITYLSGTIADNTHAVVVYLIGAFVAGFSMCMLNTVVNPMLNSLGKNQKQGNQLVQFGGSCNSLGATLAPVIVGGLIGGSANTIASANSVFYMAMAIFALAFVILYFSNLPEAEGFGTPRQAKENVKVSGALKYSNFRFGLLAIFCYVGIEVGVANWTMQYLTNSEQVAAHNDITVFSAAAIAGTVVGIYWLLMLVGRLLGGLVGGKVSSKAMLAVTSSVAIVLMILGIYLPETTVGFIGFDSNHMLFAPVQIPMNAILFIACGLCTSVMWGAIFNLSVQGLGKYTALASGLFMVMVCGGGILPTIQGFLANGSMLGSFWLPVALTAYLLVYALWLGKPDSSEPQQKEVLEEDGKPVEL
ncbi:MAG: MFS transporter [Muribaculaceae bacterium]|nr:MFS transporter [Muribaculaceae bacterium]